MFLIAFSVLVLCIWPCLLYLLWPSLKPGIRPLCFFLEYFQQHSPMLQASFWMDEAKVHLRWQLALQCLEAFNQLIDLSTSFLVSV